MKALEDRVDIQIGGGFNLRGDETLLDELKDLGLVLRRAPEVAENLELLKGKNAQVKRQSGGTQTNGHDETCRLDVLQAQIKGRLDTDKVGDNVGIDGILRQLIVDLVGAKLLGQFARRLLEINGNDVGAQCLGDLDTVDTETSQADNQQLGQAIDIGALQCVVWGKHGIGRHRSNSWRNALRHARQVAGVQLSELLVATGGTETQVRSGRRLAQIVGTGTAVVANAARVGTVGGKELTFRVESLVDAVAVADNVADDLVSEDQAVWVWQASVENMEIRVADTGGGNLKQDLARLWDWDGNLLLLQLELAGVVDKCSLEGWDNSGRHCWRV